MTLPWIWGEVRWKKYDPGDNSINYKITKKITKEERFRNYMKKAIFKIIFKSAFNFRKQDAYTWKEILLSRVGRLM